jgi:hypothetical protein
MRVSALVMPASRQSGQSSIEYILVLSLAVVALTAGSDPPIAKLAGAIRDYFGHYSYAMSFSQPPDCVQDKSIGASGPAGSSASASATVDMCPDLTNPSWPIDFHGVNITPPSVP